VHRGAVAGVAGEVSSVSELPPAYSALGAIGASVVRLKMRENFLTEQYGYRSLIASVFYPWERKLSCHTPGRIIQTQSRRTLLLSWPSTYIHLTATVLIADCLCGGVHLI